FDRLAFIEPTPAGAVTARMLRYVGRDPRRKVLLLNSVLIGLGFPLYLAFTSRGSLSPAIVLLGGAAGYIAILGAMNQFAFDGAGAGQGCGTAVIVMCCFIVQWLLLAPLGIAGLLLVTIGPAASIVVVPLALGYGALMWRVGLDVAERWAFWRQAELLAAID